MNRIVLSSLTLFFCASVAMANPNATKKNESNRAAVADVAIVIKTVKDVQAKIGNQPFKPAQRGQNLNSGDAVKTGEQSFSILRFVDGSVIRVQENSEIKVRGEKADGKMEKTVDINFGKLGFNVKQKPGEQFRFTSPTSVASIKGTSGAYMSDNEGSSLTIVEGRGELQTKDGKTFEVGAGETAFVTVTGESGKRKATQNELNSASVSAKTGPFKVRFLDADGNERILEIPEQN
ncbi:MAG: FecR family protein [Chloroherpetonaceae bacterium]|nr:FecR family protein [Chloroherpetonaceae bacterium]MDW8437226.1 FecR family protein [Chloroherpetonaceae bacterium]